MRQFLFIIIFFLTICSAAGQSVDAEAWRLTGYEAKMNGDYPLAIEYYKKILDEDSTDYDARLALARLYTLTEDYRGAIVIYEGIYGEDETDVEALIGLGECYGMLGQESKAVECYEKIMEIDDTYSEAWAGIGKMYYWMDHPATSAQYYRRAIELDPENLEIQDEYKDVRQELNWGLTFKTSPIQEKEENYTINALVSRLKLEKRVSDHFRLEANFLLDYSNRDFTGDVGDTTRWFNSSWIQADYLLRHHTISAYGGYSNTDNKVSSYGLSWKLNYEPGNFILKNNLQAGYDYYYYWNKVGAKSLTDEASARYSFVELGGRYSYGLVDPVYTIDYSVSDSLEVRENPYQSYAVSLTFKVLKRPDIRIGVSHSYLDYAYKSPLYYSPSGRQLTGATASIYYGIRNFYLYGSFSYNLGHEFNYEEGETGYDRVKLNVDNWSTMLEIGYEFAPFSFSLGGSNFYNPYYQNLTGFAAVKVLF